MAYDPDFPNNGPVPPLAGVLPPFAGIWGLMVLRGVAGIVFGLFAIFMPGIAIATMLVIFAAYMIVDGGFALAAAVRARGRGRMARFFTGEALVGLAIGLVALFWPALSVTIVVLLIAAWAIVIGGMILGRAFDHRDGRILLILCGIVSILFGLVLATTPAVGAVVLTWWLGVYALVFGIVALMFGLRLRRVMEG